ncbi:hypothetical protein AAFF_G00005560 [Aldrovandia affinis]|uniref:TGF-beta family profile domain-containing protein n=1 Tax=Aldrovandia affinis TaxID=143900 RepID=A0AAD7TDS7_9TELE|nr:hypothetical protein AAFF_G00005560 [Aldrovandia affinis]
MWPRSMFRVMLLLLPSAMATVPHRGELGDRVVDQSPKLDHPRLASVNPNRMADQIDGGKDGALSREQGDEELPLGTTRRTKLQIPRTKITSPSLTLNARWGRGSELDQDDLTRFGLCSDPDGKSSSLHAALSVLADSAEKDRGGLHIVHPTLELWEVDGEGPSRELILHFLLPLPLHPQLSRLAPTLFFSLGGSISTGGLSVSFTSHSLQPHHQTVCASAGTQYVVLPARHVTSHVQGHVAWRIVAEINQTEKAEKRNLCELLTGEGAEHNSTRRPMLLFRTDGASGRPDSPGRGLTSESSLPPATLAPSRTFLFLCDLQKFLSEVLSAESLESLQAQAAPVSLDTLQSLPPLTLDVSSSEALLLGLLNSSVPTLFSFPRRASQLLEHRVQLALQPPLLALLRLRLEEAVTQMVREGVGGCSIRGRLRRLQDLSSLPRDGEEPPAGTEKHGEAQYRALLLLKALQTVLGAWEEERPLTVSLENYMLPHKAAINNCQGTCGFPLTNPNIHVTLLNSHRQSGKPLERSPCCVPVEYEDLLVVELEGGGTQISTKLNMVAKRCGCR